MGASPVRAGELWAPDQPGTVSQGRTFVLDEVTNSFDFHILANMDRRGNIAFAIALPEGSEVPEPHAGVALGALAIGCAVSARGGARR